jgi:hypothetical protein
MIKNTIVLLAAIVLFAVSAYADDDEVVGVANGRRYCCPRGWLHYDGSCYKLFEFKKTWGEAQRYCNDANRRRDIQGGSRKRPNLVTINCKAENQFLSRAFQCSDRKDLWIGLNRRGCNYFSWISGSGANYRNFERNEPDRGDRCASIDVTHGTRCGNWEGNSCGSRKGFICEVSDSC